MTYDNCCVECLKNSESILEDAKMLFEKGKYGVAQSLSITALEEAGKAIILEFVQYDKFGRNYAKEVLNRKHDVKQGILKAIENSMILINDINQSTSYKIDKTKMEAIINVLRNQLQSWETIRQNGLYVDIDVKKAKVLSLPRNFKAEDTVDLIFEVEDIINFVKGVSWLLRESFGNSGTTINNIRQNFPAKWSFSYDEA